MGISDIMSVVAVGGSHATFCVVNWFRLTFINTLDMM